MIFRFWLQSSKRDNWNAEKCKKLADELTKKREKSSLTEKANFALKHVYAHESASYTIGKEESDSFYYSPRFLLACVKFCAVFCFVQLC